MKNLLSADKNVVSSAQESMKGSESVGQKTHKTVNGLLAAVWVLIIILCAVNLRDLSVEQVLSFTPENAFYAALIMAALFALKSLSIFIYSGILFTVNGVLFSLPVALVMDCVGIAIMSAIPYSLGRRLGGRAAKGIKERYPAFRDFDQLGHDNEFVFVSILRLIHFLPSDILSIYLGANEFRFGSYILASVLFVLPTAAMYSVSGTSISQPGSPTFIFSVVGQVAVILFSFVAMAWLKVKKDKMKAMTSAEENSPAEEN